MSREAQLLVIEYLPEPRTASWTTAFDLQQLNVTGGRGRTVREYEALLSAAGLSVEAVFKIENQDALQCSPM